MEQEKPNEYEEMMKSDEDIIRQHKKLLDFLEENEDIQKVYSNFEIDDEELDKISAEI